MGEVPNFDMIINATSLGLKKEDNLNLDFSSFLEINFFMMLFIILAKLIF